MKTIVLFNNKGGVGKTTLVYHLANMLPRLGLPTLAVDLDPQANLTSAFFDEDRLESLWDTGGESILSAITPILEGTGDISSPTPIPTYPGVHVIAGDLALSRFEDKLSESWPKTVTNDKAALRTTSAFYRIIQDAAAKTSAAVALVDVGPNLGAINRAALLAADYLLIPLAADLFSLQGLRNLGPTVRDWRTQWKRMKEYIRTSFDLPSGAIEPIGYVILQHAVRLDRPAKHFAKWVDRIPAEYHKSVLGQKGWNAQDGDPELLATLRNYRSLMPMAQDARKPMYDLRPSDGAIGSHAALVKKCREEFETLARAVAVRVGLTPEGM